jgi:transcription initiation factor TFIIH subunit 1
MSQTKYAFSLNRSFAPALNPFRQYQLSEADFWKRYFQSKLFNAHRASIRSSATQHVVKEDKIFDKYLEKDDDGRFSCFRQLIAS